MPGAGYLGEDRWALVLIHPVKQAAGEDGMSDFVSVDSLSNLAGKAKVLTELGVGTRPGVVGVTCEPDPRDSRSPQPSLKMVR